MRTCDHRKRGRGLMNMCKMRDASVTGLRSKSVCCKLMRPTTQFDQVARLAGSFTCLVYLARLFVRLALAPPRQPLSSC